MSQADSIENQDEEISTGYSEELYERLTLSVDKGQEPLRVDRFIFWHFSICADFADCLRR